MLGWTITQINVAQATTTLVPQTAFEIVQGTAPNTFANIALDGNGGVPDVNVAGDWGAAGSPPPDGSGLYLTPGQTPGSLKSTGILDFRIQVDVGGTGDQLIPCSGSDADAFGGGAKIDDLPWNLGVQSNVNNKADVCSAGAALEIVEVPTVGGSQVNYIYYGYVARSADATGDMSTYINLEGPQTGRTDDLLIKIDFDPSGSSSVEVMTWDGVGAVWVSSGPTTNTADIEVGIGQNDFVGDTSTVNDDTFYEYALNLTSLGIIPEGQCVEFTNPIIITQTGEAQNSSTIDAVIFSDPLLVNNCNNMEISKVSDPAGISSQDEFTYLIEQSDDKPTHGVAIPPALGSLTVSGNSVATTEPDSDQSEISQNILIGETHTWVNVIGEPDYQVFECGDPATNVATYDGAGSDVCNSINTLGSWELDKIECTYTDIFGDGDGIDNQDGTRTVTLYELDAYTGSHFDIFGAEPGTIPAPTCTITNKLTGADWGDAPGSYGTSGAAGPAHIATSNGVYLGSSAADKEADGQVHASALGDDNISDDEDGLDGIRILTYSSGGVYYLPVRVTNTSGGAAQLVGWLDWGAKGAADSAQMELFPDGSFAELRDQSGPDLAAIDCDYNGAVDIDGYVMPNYVAPTGGSVDGTFDTGNIPDGCTGIAVLKWEIDLPLMDPSADSFFEPFVRLRITTDGRGNSPSTGFFSENSPSPSGLVADGEVEDHLVTIPTTPITLGYFHAEAGVNAGDVEFSWQTVTELGNLGFNLYVSNGKGGWNKINAELIPSQSGSPVETQTYHYTAHDVQGETFQLGDVSARGGETLHGPFPLGAAQGVDRSNRAATDWKGIKAERKSKQKVLKSKRQQQLDRKIERKLDSGEQQMRRNLKIRRSSSGSTDLSRRSMTDSINQSLVSIEATESVPLHSSWRSRLMASVLSLFIANAHAMEPIADVGEAHLDVEEKGIQRLSFEELLAAGIDLSGVLHGRLAVTSGGQPVAVQTAGQDKVYGSQRYFGPGGWIEFIGEPEKDLYSTSGVYTLHVDAGKRLDAMEDSTSPPKRGVVPVSVYQANYASPYEQTYSLMSPNGDPWYLARVMTEGDTDWSSPLPFFVNDYAAGQGPVNFSLDIWGYSSGLHEFRVEHQSQLVDEAQFFGIEPHTLAGPLSAGSVVEGQNSVMLTLPGRGVTDAVALDQWRVEYPRYTIAQDGRLSLTATGDWVQVSGMPSNSVRVYRQKADGSTQWLSKPKIESADGAYRIILEGDIQEADYHVASVDSLLSPGIRIAASQEDLTTGEAQYLIIAHPDFIDSNMEQLVNARQAQYSVKVADVEAVYSAFGHGRFGAQPIKDYIAWAQANLGTEMVLLVGSDQYDYHNYQYPDAVSFLPSIYAKTGPLVNMAPVDGKYVDIDDDNVPDLAIGRLIPRNSAEWAASVAKTLAYAYHPNPQSSVFAADEYDAAQGYDFSADAEHMLAQLPAVWQANATKAYIDELGRGPARAQLLEAFNSGPALVSYVGHSGTRDWTFAGLFRAGDANTLNNQGAASVVTQWGCWNTFYVSPLEDSLAHEFWYNTAGGAAAVLGAATLTYASRERALAEQVYGELFEPGQAIGQSVLEAKQSYAEGAPNHLDIILGWNLLADPGLVMVN